MDEATFYGHIEGIKANERIAVDTENSGTIRSAELWSGQHYLTGISAAWRSGNEVCSAYFPRRHESDNLPREWFDILGSVLLNRELIFLNAKFDIAALSTIGFDALQCPRIWDIATMAHMVNEEFPSKALDWLSKFILKDQKDSDKVLNWAKFFGWHSIPVQLMDPYASKDAELTLRLFDILYREMI